MRVYLAPGAVSDEETEEIVKVRFKDENLNYILDLPTYVTLRG